MGAAIASQVVNQEFNSSCTGPSCDFSTVSQLITWPQSTQETAFAHVSPPQTDASCSQFSLDVRMVHFKPYQEELSVNNRFSKEQKERAEEEGSVRAI